MSETKPLNAKVWERQPNSFYVEEARCTTQLLEVERFEGAIIDPCCGTGNIPRECQRAGYSVFGADISPWLGIAHEPWFLGQSDFYDETGLGLFGVPNCVSNPPYAKKGIERAIWRALALATGKIAIYVPIGFLSGGSRANGLYLTNPPNRVWNITPRPSAPPIEYLEAGGEPENGRADFAWIVWDQPAERLPRGSFAAMGWLR